MKTILLALGYWCLVSAWVAFGWMLAATIQKHRRTRRITKNVMGAIEQWEPVEPVGWIAESRFTLYADSEAEAIARLIGERK